MEVLSTPLKGVLIIEPDVFEDKRGFLMESFHCNRYKEHGIACDFVQDNLSRSVKHTLRGLHYQFPHAQAKLVQVVYGVIFDVTVDIRVGSSTFGQWTATELSDRNRRQLYIPGGFGHGFCVLSDSAFVAYKCNDFYAPTCEGGILWSDPCLNIDWPVKQPIISEKDSQYPLLKDVPSDRLPPYAP